MAIDLSSSKRLPFPSIGQWFADFQWGQDPLSLIPCHFRKNPIPSDSSFSPKKRARVDRTDVAKRFFHERRFSTSERV